MVGDWADDREFGPVDCPAATDGRHDCPEGIHRGEHLAVGCDCVHHAADIGGFELVLFDQSLIDTEINEFDFVLVVVEFFELGCACRTYRAHAVVENDDWLVRCIWHGGL